MYLIIFLFQLILLSYWTFTHEGVVKENGYIKNVGTYVYEICSMGNKYVLYLIFFNDFILLIISTFISYQGRNSKYCIHIYILYIIKKIINYAKLIFLF